MRCVDAIRPMERIGGNKPQGIYFTELAHSEQAKIRKLRIKLMEHLGQSPCFMYFNPAERQALLAQLEAKDVRLFVATDGGTPVAYAEVSYDGENFATEAADMLNITGAYCQSAYRGQDIYPALLDHLILVLKSEGYRRLGVDFESFNPAAFAFWGKYFTYYTNSLVRRIDECALPDAEGS